MDSLLSAISLLKALNPLRLINAARSYLTRWLMLRRPVKVEVAAVSYQGPHPHKDEFQVSNVICQVAISNPSDIPNAIGSFRLEIADREPIYAAEHRRTEDGADILVPRGGGFSSVPTKDRWLDTSVKLEPWGAETGWVGFEFLEPGYQLTFGEARALQAELVVTPVRGDPARVRIPACKMPDLSG